MMEQAQEQLNNKNIDVEQYGSMIKQIFEINESKKLLEAKRIELKNSKGKVWQQNDLTPISDDESSFVSNNDEEKDKQARKDRLKFKKRKIESDDEKKSSPTPIISSFAQSTAAELRNSGNERKESRWGKPENTRWGSIWEQQPQTTNPPNTSSVLQNNAWNNNIKPNIILPNVQPAPPPPLPLFHNSNIQLPSPWQNNVAFNPSVLPTIPLLPTVPVIPQSTLPTLDIPINKNIVNSDVVRQINIDQVSREIRFYDDIAIAFMNWDEPKEIGFQSGQRRVIVDDKDSIVLGFNEPSKNFLIDGKNYQIRFGSPTRELYVDGTWYECFFGDPPIGIHLDGKMRIFKIDGPPPPVKIGNLRHDLVVGKITLIIDAKDMVPVFLDSKKQFFELDGQINTIQFADYLLTVLINDEPFSVEFGGLPKSIYIKGKKRFIRFRALPNGIEPGRVFIRNMVRTNLNRDVISPPAPAIVSLNDVPQSDNTSAAAPTSSQQQQSTNNVPGLNIPPILDILSILPKPAPLATAASFDSCKSDIPPPPIPPPTPTTVLQNVDIDDLYQKLLASGILNKPTVTAEKPKEDKKPKEIRIKPINLTLSESIKT